ncbi:MAG: hypothetical protein KDB00_07210 [Planctomycetales bacterium]|nr:hypothetical protein [Planctomycetales bacterium]
MNESGESGAVRSAVLLSGDLMFASRVRGAAEAAGLDFQMAGALPDKQGIEFVIVDLATRSSVVDGLMDSCRRICPQARVIAFGPHVQVARLDDARAAGIPVVLTRGQFDRELGGLFEE